MGIDNLFLALWIGIPTALFVIMLICIKYFSEAEIPKIKVLNDVEKTEDYFGLHVKNVGAEGKVTATLENNSAGLFKVRWFKFRKEMKGAGGEKERTLVRGEESFVVISRRAVNVAETIPRKTLSDLGWHHITVRFPEADQIFKYSFRITEGGIEDLEFLGEEDE